MQKSEHKFFYGWVIVAAGFVIMGVSMGVVSNSFGLFIKPMAESLKLGRASVQGIQSVTSAAQMITALLSGKIFSKFDVKKTMCVSAVALSIAYFCNSLVSNLWGFYVLAAIAGVTMGTLHMVPLSIILNNWFYQRRGFALGLCFMGSGVGGMVFNSLSGSLIESLGWRSTFQILGGTMFVLLVPVTFFLIKTRPQDMGLSPLGSDDCNVVDPKNLPGTTLKEAMKNPRLWLICFVAIISEIAMYGLMVNTAPHISDLGYSVALSAGIASACMGALAVGKLTLGTLFDKWGIRAATGFAYIATLVGVSGTLLARFSPALALVVIGSGLGGAFGSVGYPILVQRIYGQREYAGIYGLISAFARFGDMITPLFMGTIFDATGSYMPAYGTLAVITVIAGVLIQLALPKKANDSAEEERATATAK